MNGRATPAHQGSNFSVARSRAHLGRVEIANWRVDHNDFERGVFVEDVEECLVDPRGLGSKGRPRHFCPLHEPARRTRRHAGDDAIGKCGTAMKTHPVSYTLTNDLSIASRVRTSSFG